MIVNIHERLIHATPAKVGSLLDQLGLKGNSLWPADQWPSMRFDRPLEVGARGGHGPIRYFVEAYEPGRSITFRFTGPRGFNGTHDFEVESVEADSVVLRHVLRMRTSSLARLSWPLAFRRLHDALLEDALDCAEAYCEDKPVSKRDWSWQVRLLRTFFSVASSKRQSPDKGIQERVSRSPH